GRAPVPPPMPSLGSEVREDSSEMRATEVRSNDAPHGPIATSGPSAPTMHAMAPERTDTEPTNMGPDFVESPSEVLAPLTHKLPPPRPMPSPSVGAAGPSIQKDPFDDQTAVASPTEALLRATRENSQVAPHPVDESLEQEFQQVYRDFIETKQACGEST